MIRQGRFTVAHRGEVAQVEAFVDTEGTRLWVNPKTHYEGCPWHDVNAVSSRPDEVPEAVWTWARSVVEQGNNPTDWMAGELVFVVTSLAPRQAESARLTWVDRPSAGDRRFVAQSLHGKTQYEGWISTFHFKGSDTLCARDEAERSETMLYVYTTRPVL